MSANAHFDSPLTRDFPSTSKLTREDLEELLASSEGRGSDGGAYFEAFVHSLPEVKAMYDEHAQLIKDNEDRAARNLAMQPPLEALRRETQEYYDRALAAQAQWPTVEAEMKEQYRRFAPSYLHAQVVQKASKLHEESEALAAAFVEGQPLPASSTQQQQQQQPGDPTPSSFSQQQQQQDDAVFVRRYREMRAEYHRLNLVADQWAKGAVQWE